jgi:hypothetical protein
MFSAFIGGFLGASLAMHSSVVAAIFSGIFGLLALLFGVMLLWFLVVAVVYYVGIPLWRFVILPAMFCFMAVIAAPFYIPFILVPWGLRRLFRTTHAAGDPLWHPLRGLDDMPRDKRFEWANRYGRDA